jgi:hypothetical protein
MQHDDKIMVSPVSCLAGLFPNSVKRRGGAPCLDATPGCGKAGA